MGESTNGNNKYKRAVGMGIHKQRANALRANGGQRVGGTMGVRRLTPTETELLQGLPRDWTKYRADGTEQKDTHRYHQTGNGLAVPVVDWIIKRLLIVDKGGMP